MLLINLVGTYRLDFVPTKVIEKGITTKSDTMRRVALTIHKPKTQIYFCLNFSVESDIINKTWMTDWCV